MKLNKDLLKSIIREVIEEAQILEFPKDKVVRNPEEKSEPESNNKDGYIDLTTLLKDIKPEHKEAVTEIVNKYNEILDSGEYGLYSNANKDNAIYYMDELWLGLTPVTFRGNIKPYIYTLKPRKGTIDKGGVIPQENRIAKTLEYYLDMGDRIYNNKKSWKEQKEKRKAEAFENGNPFKIGDVLYNSFGYDMTLNDFYKVIGTTPKSIKLQPIASEIISGGGYTGEEKPIDKPINRPIITARVTGKDNAKYKDKYLRRTDWDTEHYYNRMD